MTIALLTDGIWPFVIGGMQRHSFYLCKYLARNQVRVVLYHTTKNGKVPDLKSCFQEDELKYIEGHYVIYPHSDKLPGNYLRSSFKYSESIFNEIKNRTDLDIIYAKGLAGWKLLKENKNRVFPPICVNVHGYEYFQRAGSLKAKLQQYMLRPAFNYINQAADYIFSYGGGISDIIKQFIPASQNKIIEIPAGIERQYLTDKPKEVNSIRKLVFLGRFERRKGVQELIKAISEIDSESLKYQLDFIGAIPEKLRIQNPSTIYWGQLNDSIAIREILLNADVLICPSYAEGMPNVIMEAMSCGCAIIATNVGAISLQVGEDNGWIISPGSSSELYNAIKEAIELSEKNLYSKKLNSIEKVKNNFVWDDLINKVILAFNTIIFERKRKHAE